MLFWLAGLLLMFYPTLLSGFAHIVGEPGDPRLVAYLLEHTFRWIMREPLHASLWNPPFYHPAENVLAFSEVLLGVAPLYWVWRWVGIQPDGAYQAFLLTATTLTYVSTFVLFRRGFGYERVPAAAGALLFAFGAPRIAHVLHAQLLPHFYTPLAILALVRLFRSDRPQPAWTAVLVTSVVLQLYAAFYYAWLLGLALLIALLLGALRVADRGAIRRVLVLNARVAAVCVLVAGALTVPLARHYLEAAQLLGFRDWATEVAPIMPVPQSWLSVGPQNAAYFWLMNTTFFRVAQSPEGSLGIGFVATGVAVAGLVWGRRDRAVALMALTGAVLIALSTIWPPGWSPWQLVHQFVPGAAALRAVARVGLLVLLALALGFATAAQHLRRRSAGAMILAIGIPILEQLQWVPWFSKAERTHQAAEITAQVRPGCRSFYYAVLVPASVWPPPHRPWMYQLHAMDAQLRVTVPTVNGYSGSWPPRWGPLYDNVLRDVADTVALRQRLAQWAPALPAPCIVIGAVKPRGPPD